MNLLQRVRQQYQSMSRPKAISHRPDLEGREHVYSSYNGSVEQEMNRFADYATVYSCYAWVKKAVTVIAENIASLPVRVVDGKDKPLDGHPLSILLATVNDEDAPAMLWRSYTVNMLLGGETFYQFVPDGRGRPAEIWMRRPDQVGVLPNMERLNYPTAAGYIFTGEDNQMLTIPPEQMAHDRFYNPLNAWRGLAPIHAVREGITTDLYAQSYNKNFYRQSARPDFAIVAPQGITKSERDSYEADFLRKHQGASKAHLPVILEQGVTDIKTFSFPPKDLEWLQQREYNRDEIGAVFGVPDEIMGYGRDTYENFGTALEVFWTLTLLPIIRSRDVTLTRHFAKYGFGLLPGQRIDTDLSGVDVLQEDLLPKIDMATKLFAMGVPFNTLDEKFKLGFGPVEGGDVGFVSSSVVPVEQATEPPQPPPQLVMPPQDARPVDEPVQDAPVDEPPAKFILPEGAKEQAKRVLKKILQRWQDADLRAIREGGPRPSVLLMDTELERWLGTSAYPLLCSLANHVSLESTNHDTLNAAYNELKSDASLSRMLEVEAATTFFPLSGPITHEQYAAFKAMVLQLDDSDDEAEQQARMELERKLAHQLTIEFNAQLNALVPPDASDDEVRAAPAKVDDTSGKIRDALRRSLEQSSSLGVTVALDTLQQVGIGFDWQLAHTEAARWASTYSYELVRGINSTTRGRLQVAIDEWFRNGDTLPQLRKELAPTFGRKRANMIAATETTRAAREGSVIGYEHSGVVGEAEWVTVNDEKVCPVCGSLHGKRATLRGTFDGASYPPAHPGCRCFVRPVIEDAK